MLLAYEKGAELIVAVGTHFNLVEFLERNRSGMSSTFLTRLRVGEILVDAKGVSRLVSRRVGVWPLVAVALAGLAAILVAILVSPTLQDVLQLARDAPARTSSASAEPIERCRARARDGGRGTEPAAAAVASGRYRRRRRAWRRLAWPARSRERSTWPAGPWLG